MACVSAEQREKVFKKDLAKLLTKHGANINLLYDREYDIAIQFELSPVVVDGKLKEEVARFKYHPHEERRMGANQ
jgi:uncharacterized protein YqgQ